MAAPIHLQPTAPLAPRVLLPGDPGRALLIAQAVLTEPKMFNHNRGLWGYSGTAADGEPLTVQSTGMGGPSAAIVISELCDLGARTLLRTGTCGGLHPDLELGQLLVVTEAIADDGTSRALGAEGHVGADAGLVARLTEAAGGPPRAGRSFRPTSSTTRLKGPTADGSPTARSRSRWRRRPCSRSPPAAACAPERC